MEITILNQGFVSGGSNIDHMLWRAGLVFFRDFNEALKKND